MYMIVYACIRNLHPTKNNGVNGGMLVLNVWKMSLFLLIFEVFDPQSCS